jgi:hypothetical protein
MSIRSNRPFSITTSTISVNRNLHDNKPLVLNVSGGVTVTLPKATGSGATYFFIVGTASNANVISASAAAATFVGGYTQNDSGDTSPATADFFPTAAGNNTFSPTTVGGGGAAGDWFRIIDYATDTYLFNGTSSVATDPSNRFSTV